MSRRSLVFVSMVIAALGGASSPSQAQTHPIIGSWKISFAAGTRMENGTATTITGTGKLVVQLQGDSLVARLIPDPIDGTTRPESRMAALSGAGKVVFVQRGQARVNTNGEISEVTSISTWTMTAQGDVLEGTVERRLEGIDAPSRGPQPVSGTRIKGQAATAGARVTRI